MFVSNINILGCTLFYKVKTLLVFCHLIVDLLVSKLYRYLVLFVLKTSQILSSIADIFFIVDLFFYKLHK